MRVRKWIIPITALLLTAALWLSGLIPAQIAELSGSAYVRRHFPDMELTCTAVEYSSAFGSYLIYFEDPGGNSYSCVIGPAFLPVSMGQGLFAIEDSYNRIPD